ncbi:MAG: TrbC/VirB2 family protein [Methanobacteriota archaeon]
MKRSIGKTLLIILLSASNTLAQVPEWESFEDDVVRIFSDVMCRIAKVILFLAGPIAVFVLVWAGLQWIYSQEDPAERERAKELIIQVILAVILLRVAKSIAEFILYAEFSCSLF